MLSASVSMDEAAGFRIGSSVVRIGSVEEVRQVERFFETWNAHYVGWIPKIEYRVEGYGAVPRVVDAVRKRLGNYR